MFDFNFYWKSTSLYEWRKTENKFLIVQRCGKEATSTFSNALAAQMGLGWGLDKGVARGRGNPPTETEKIVVENWCYFRRLYL